MRGASAGALAFLATLTVATPAAADIYRLIDEDGVIRLSDKPQGPGWRLVVRTRKGWDPERVRPIPENRTRFWPLVDAAAHRHGLNQALIDAVIVAESGYDHRAVSRAGAVGLMQLMPATALAYGVRDREDPAQNVDGGARYLRDLLTRYLDLELALAAYNAGETAVERHGRQIPPYPETQNYVSKVLTLFRARLASGAGP